MDGPREISVKTGGVYEARSGFDAEIVIPYFRFHGKNYVDGQLVEEDEAEAFRRAGFNEQRLQEHEEANEEELDDVFEESDISGAEGEEGPIYNLILTVKAPICISALQSVKHRLTPQSTILFLQNGMGLIEDVNEQVFPNPATRPHYMVGINTHGTNSPSSWVVEHAGFGTMSLGITQHEAQAPEPDPRNKDAYLPMRWAPTSRYMLRTLTRTPALCAVGFPPSELIQLQLEKLAVNAIINPLTALLDARNGSILYNYPLTRVMRLLLAEISMVIRQLPELRGLPNIDSRFGPDKLEARVVSVAGKTKDNISSMLADTRAGLRTEIKYINGYVVRRGEEMGVKCVMNYMLWQLVRGKQKLVSWENNEDLPFVRTPPGPGSS